MTLYRALKPAFARKILSMDKNGKFKKYSSVKQLREEIEHA